MIKNEILEELTEDHIISCLEMLFPNDPNIGERVDKYCTHISIDDHTQTLDFLELNPTIGMSRLASFPFKSKKYIMIISHIEGLIRGEKISDILDNE